MTRRKAELIRKPEDLDVALRRIVQMAEEDEKIGRLLLINPLLTFRLLGYRVSSEMKEQFVRVPRKRSKLDKEEMARVTDGKALKWIKRVRIRPRRKEEK